MVTALKRDPQIPCDAARAIFGSVTPAPLSEQTRCFPVLSAKTENTRADLVDTVDKLHNRVSPQAIKEEVKAYAREASYDLIHDLERRARENPLQTVAVAAGLAYPAWRFLINIPAPILLVGAGLALTQMGASTR